MRSLSETDIRKTLSHFVREAIPFCVVRFPNESDAELYTEPAESPAQDDYLAVMPWKPEMPTYYFAPYQQGGKSAPVKLPQTSPDAATFERYSKHFNTYKVAIEKGEVQKAILSRIHTVSVPENFDPIAWFYKLSDTYPAALTYLLLHPTEGYWSGATPEVLLQYQMGKYHTVSLAGTQPRSAAPYVWGAKERDEQELVSQHIREVIRHCNGKNVLETEPETVEAGGVAHLCSHFSFTTPRSPSDFRDIVHQLHPTPAVAGLPIQSACELINQTEDHSRSLYTGVLGRKKGESIDYYVNLRCMRVFHDKLCLYLGGGITLGSELTSEWQETEKKARTLLNLIDYGKEKHHTK